MTESFFKDASLSSVLEYSFENANDAIYILDTRGNLAAANSKAEELTGFRREDFIGKPFRKTISSKNLPKDNNDFLDVLKGRPIKLETELKTAFKKTIPVEVSSVPLIINGRVVGVFAIVRDITGRLILEKNLKGTNKKLEMIFATAMEGITLVDFEENLTFVNKAFAKMLGYYEKELIGMNLRKLVDEKSFEQLRKRTDARRRGTTERYELVLYRKDGEPCIVQVSAAPLRNGDGSFAGSVGIVMDVTEQKRAEKMLRENQQKFERFFMGNPEPTVYLSPDLIILDINPRFREVFGFSLDEIKGKNIDNVIVPKEKMEEAKVLDKKAGAGYVHHDTFRKRKDGSLVPVSISAAPIVIEDKLVGYVGLYQDITMQKKVEEKIKESEERFRQLIEYAPDAIYLNDLQGNFLDGNKQAEILTGYKKEELIGKNILEVGVLPKKYAPKVMKDLMDALSGRKTGPDEYELVRKDGKCVTAEISTFPVKRAGKVEVIGIARDVTERKQMEERLKDSEEKFRSLVEMAPDGILTVNPQGTVTSINASLLRLIGYDTEEEIVGKPFTNMKTIQAEDIPRFQEMFVSMMKGKSSSPSEFFYVRKDGTSRWAEVHPGLLKKNGDIIGLQAIMRDITERKNMEEKLKEYTERLEEKVEERTRELKNAQERLVKSERLAAIGEIAAMVGHDLRNPLTGIAGATYYLKMKQSSTSDPKINEMLEIIEKDILYSNKIINDLLDYSREIHLQLTKTSAKSMIKEALSSIEVPKNIQIIDSALNEPAIKVDMDKMKRVFINIIKNAIDAMPKGGKLTIKSAKLNENMQISFSDTGVGMTRETLEKIWTPLFTTKAKGMGLGLPICKRIVEAHSGSISVESIVGKGTTFTVTIPIEPNSKTRGEKIWVNELESLSLTTTKA